MTYQLDIDDDIGTWGISKAYVRESLADFQGKPVNVRISSLGGDAMHGLDIRQQFIDHGNVTVFLQGCVASAATIIAMGAKTVKMSKYALFLVHQVSSRVDEWGTYNSDEIQELIKKLQEKKDQNDKFDRVLASIYANKCGKKVEDMLEVLREAKWLTAQQALEFGFVDEITEEEDEQRMNYAGLTHKINRMGYPALPSDMVKGKEGLLQTILGKVQVILDEIGQNRKGKGINQDNQNQNVMTNRNEFKLVNTVLGCETLAFSEQGTLFNESQVQMIEAAFKKKDDDAEALRKERDELAAQVKNLQESTAEISVEVDNSQEEEEDVMADARKLYNAVR
jgi:ATP-dependent protease ClpP protease subunit